MENGLGAEYISCQMRTEGGADHKFRRSATVLLIIQQMKGLPSRCGIICPYSAAYRFDTYEHCYAKAMERTDGIYTVFIFLGTPIIAVDVGLILAVYTLALRDTSRGTADEDGWGSVRQG